MPMGQTAQSVHGLMSLVSFALLGYCLYVTKLDAPEAVYKRSLGVVGLILTIEAIAHFLVPVPHMSVAVMVFLSVLFTISPVQDTSRLFSLHMGTVPPLCIVWLCATGLLSMNQVVTALYGSDSLRPYHLVVMFLGSVYLCTALERSGFLHTAAVKVVSTYGRSPWGLFWALGCFSATLTVLIPDDIVTMTLTPITIRMCQLLNLPEIPFLFSQFFAGNIWAVTLVTGNPTNVLLAEDLGDTFVSFAARMGIPGIVAGLVSFALMYMTNRNKVDVVAHSDRDAGSEELARGGELARLSPRSDPSSSLSPRDEHADGGNGNKPQFTATGCFCLVRVVSATLVCALESFHGLPVYLVVLIIGLASLCFDMAIDFKFSVDVLNHMPWELFSFVTGFLVLAEAMSVYGISLWMASIFLPFTSSRNVAFISGYLTMIFCNIFETLPATLIVFKMIDSVPQWKSDFIATAGFAATSYKDARRAALSAVIFGSNFGANTACIGSLGGLMMRRLATLQGVTVTNSMLLRQGIPVMIPVMFAACFVLINQKSI